MTLRLPVSRAGARLLPALLLPALAGGCTVDLLVGEPSGSTGNETAAATDEGDTTSPAPIPDPSSSSTTAQPEATEGEGTTHVIDDTTTGPGEGATTTTGSAEEGTTTLGEIPCEGLGMLDCNDLPYCLWYGDPELGECLPNPCEDPLHECLELSYELCDLEFACAWEGDPELGDCGPIECVPCEILGLEQCSETPTCEWVEMEMFCFPA